MLNDPRRLAYVLVPIAIFLAASIVLTAFKIVRTDELRADSAMYFQLTENIAQRGVPVSQVNAAIGQALQSGFTTMTPQQLASAPLPGSDKSETNIIRSHGYFILYPIALLSKIFPVEPLLLALYVLSFTGIVLMAYFILRKKGVPAAIACLFCLLIVSHPAWSMALLWGQFYPDRLFIVTGFALMSLTYRTDVKKSALILAAILCALTVERGTLIAGVFLFGYAILYWRTDKSRYFKLGLGAALLVVAFIEFRMLVVDNPFNASFMPTSIAQIVANFRNPSFSQAAEVFAIVNLPFLLIAIFEPRAAALAVLLMLPNLLGTHGGGEKTGWITHYHSFYFPALVWAALLGFNAAYRKAIASRYIVPFCAAVCLAIVFVSMVDQYSQTVSVKLSNISNNFMIKAPTQLSFDLGPQGFHTHQLALRSIEELRQAIPEGSEVSTPEQMMPFLYHNRTIQYLPIDIDHADYAVLIIMKQEGKVVTYGGVYSYLGPAAAIDATAAIITRMRKDGYDFIHPLLFPALNMAVIRRAVERPALP